MPKMQVICLLLAAGSSERMDHNLPKAYLPLKSNNLLKTNLLNFNNNSNIDGICVIYNKEHLELLTESLEDLNKLPIIEKIIGGKTRQESVFLGLKAIKKYNPDIVLIHDVARPFVSQQLIDQLILTAKKHEAVIPVLKVNDTLKECNNNIITKTISREHLFKAQTPQAFNFTTIFAAHNYAKENNITVTDDAALLEDFNKEVHTITGSFMNFKITNIDDYNLAKMIMNNSNYITRIGTGFDVHAFETIHYENNFITLGGIKISHPYKLIGHSDSDVALHAITDALLGSLALGDIGEYFPPTDNAFKNMDSTIFLKKARDLIKEHNAIINNIDITIICESPKITPHKKAMQEKIADILEVNNSQISVKATTTEKLGFTGRKEGIAVQAVASIMVSS